MCVDASDQRNLIPRLGPTSGLGRVWRGHDHVLLARKPAQVVGEKFSRELPVCWACHCLQFLPLCWWLLMGQLLRQLVRRFIVRKRHCVRSTRSNRLLCSHVAQGALVGCFRVPWACEVRGGVER